MFNITGGVGITTSAKDNRCLISWNWIPIDEITRDNFVPCIITDGKKMLAVHEFPYPYPVDMVPLTHYLPLPDLPGYKGQVEEHMGIEFELGIPVKISTKGKSNDD